MSLLCASWWQFHPFSCSGQRSQSQGSLTHRFFSQTSHLIYQEITFKIYPESNYFTISFSAPLSLAWIFEITSWLFCPPPQNSQHSSQSEAVGIYVICPSCGQNSAVTSHFTHFKICRKLCYQALPLISIPALLCLLLWVQSHWSPLVFSFCYMWWNVFPPLPQLPQVLVKSEFLREAHFVHPT